jgi:hypothetical protein
MSDPEDREPYNTARPYECVACGVTMRTRGVDGRCYQCIAAPPLRCATCARVRFDPGGDWQPHPGLLPREVEGICKTCGDWAHRQREIQYARECRRTAARAAKGYGGPAEGEDVFRGMRGQK